MQTQATNQTFAEDIKKEVLRELQRTQAPNMYNSLSSHQHCLDRNLLESIKREILLELDIPPQGQPQASNRAFIEAVKRDVLALLQSELRMSQPNRALIQAIKRDVIAQIEAQQEAQEVFTRQQVQPGGYHALPNPALIQAVKSSVMAELQMPAE